MTNIQVVQNTFDKSTLRSLTEILRMINFNQPRGKIGMGCVTQLRSWRKYHRSSIFGLLGPILHTSCSIRSILQPSSRLRSMASSHGSLSISSIPRWSSSQKWGIRRVRIWWWSQQHEDRTRLKQHHYAVHQLKIDWVFGEVLRDSLPFRSLVRKGKG